MSVVFVVMIIVGSVSSVWADETQQVPDKHPTSFRECLMMIAEQEYHAANPQERDEAHVPESLVIELLNPRQEQEAIFLYKRVLFGYTRGHDHIVLLPSIISQHYMPIEFVIAHELVHVLQWNTRVFYEEGVLETEALRLAPLIYFRAVAECQKP